jgi:molecular chaperone GrpE
MSSTRSSNKPSKEIVRGQPKADRAFQLTMSSSDINGKTIVDIQQPVQQSEIEILRAQLRSEHDMYLRSLADFDNYRRRVERDAAGAVERGKRSLILAFLEVVDSFDRALLQVGDAASPLVEGLEAVHRKTLALLEAQGITPYNSVGEAFNPALHEAVASIAGTPQYPPGVVADELQRGYKAGDAVFRPAQVRVSQQS